MEPDRAGAAVPPPGQRISKRGLDDRQRNRCLSIHGVSLFSPLATTSLFSSFAAASLANTHCLVHLIAGLASRAF